MYNYKIENQDRIKKNWCNLMMVHLFIENWIQSYTNFSVWLRTSSNPLDINRFQSVTVKTLTNILEL